MMQLCKPVVALPAALYLLAMEQTRRIGKRLRARLKSELQGGVFLLGVFKKARIS